jgi:cytochrome c
MRVDDPDQPTIFEDLLRCIGAEPVDHPERIICCGKSCRDCHTEDSLRGAAGDYPKYNAKQGRLMSLMDTVNLMISSNMTGKVLPLGDENTVALEAYLKSLR